MPTLDEYIKSLDREITARLSLAVALIDGYTGKQPIGDVNVFIEKQNFRAVRNRGGYHLFLNLPDGRYTLRMEPEHYFDEEKTKKLSDLDPSNPVVSIRLKPKPSYPFPCGATLIRGMVEDVNGNRVSGAKVEVIGKEVSNRTTAEGEFVLYFKALTEDDDIIIESSRRFVKGTGSKIVSLRATSGSKKGTVDLEEVEEGKTTLLESPIILT